jgi:hypothetical protein
LRGKFGGGGVHVGVLPLGICKLFDQCDEPFGGVRHGHAQRRLGHADGGVGLFQDGRDGGGQDLGRQLAFGHQGGGLGIDGTAGVGGLLVAHGGGVGDVDRGPSHDADIGDGGRAGACDDKLRLGQAAGHVVEEGLDLGADVERGIGLGHAVDILGTRLLRHAQKVAQVRRQKRDGGGHDIGQHPRALAAAEDQKAHRPVAGRHVGRTGARQDRGADRVAGMDAGHARGQCRGPCPAGHRIDPAREEPVDPAQHAVLFVDRPRTSRQPGRGHGRDRRVAAEAHDHGGPFAQHAHRRARDAGEDAERHQRLGQRPAPREGGRGHLPHVDGMGEAAGIPRPARIGRQRHPPALAHHRLGQRLGGEHVPPGAACRDDQMWCARVHGVSVMASGWRVAGMSGEEDIADIALWTGAGETQHHAHRNARRDQR